jgi:hypothetical protein
VRLVWPLRRPTRSSPAIILDWIGALKLVDPSSAVGLSQASLPSLGFNGFVYAVSTIGIVVAIRLETGIAQAFAGPVAEEPRLDGRDD